MNTNPLQEMLADQPEESTELETAFSDFDNAELPLQVRAEALKLIMELTQ